ncbi:MAG: gliding motility-associated C-terminal domain-containing protein [Bacteroidetes bacterium]|nr:gliding motility-associated C-terminal domain-containing protein [Bacteroidota bacterium]
MCRTNADTNSEHCRVSYTWSDGTTNNSITVNTSGTYWLEIDNGSCTGRDSIDIIISTSGLSVNLGNDTSLCAGQTLTLTQNIAGVSYTWSDGTTNNSITVNTSGTYWLEIDNGSCTGRDSIDIIISTSGLSVNLGNDTSLCAGQTLTLTQNIAGVNYTWSDGTTNNSITVNTSGTYWLEIDNGSCTGRDSIDIIISTSGLSVNLGNDTSLCSGQTMTLTQNIAGVNYTWSDGTTNNSITVNTSGTYWLEIDNGSCTGRDSIDINISTSGLSLNLGNDTSLCAGQTLTLTQNIAGVSYTWSDGTTNNSITVNTSGTYWLEIDNGSCTGRDSIDIIISTSGLSVNLGNDTSLCAGQTLTLTQNIAGVSYTWSDGTTNNSITVNTSGTYWLEIDNGSCTGRDSIDIIISTSGLSLNLGNDTSLCAGQTLTLTQNIAGVSYTWSDGTTNNSITVNTSGTYWLEIDNGSCTGRDSIDIIISTSGLSVNLGNDTSLCAGQTLTLTQNIAGVSYTWSDGTTNNSITVNTSGTYWLEIDNGSCTGRDSIDINISTSGLSLNLGNDTSLCAGQTLTLTQNIAGVNYTWSDGTTNNSITVNTSGTYWLEIDNGSCTGRDSIDIIISTSGLSLNLGNDTSLCAGQTLTLTQNIAGVSYTWSDGTTNNSITVNTSGTYWLEIDNGSCTGRDSIDIIISTSGLSLNLGNDTSLCAGQTLTLTQNIAGVNYTWSDGTTNNSITVNTSGTYWLEIDNGSCTGRDSIDIIISTSGLSVNLGNDTSLCAGQTLTLTQNIAGVNYTWSDGTTNNSITVNTGGTYWLEIDNGSCTGRDSIDIIISTSGLSVNLGNDTSLCAGQTLTLTQNIAGVSYTWSDGTTNNSITVNTSGTYWLEIKRSNCSFIDSINIDFAISPFVDLGSDTTICENEKIYYYLPAGEYNYVWSNGITSPNGILGGPGIFWVNASNGICSIFDTIIVKLDPNCDCKFFIPNAFSPNNDGINDNFYVNLECQVSNFSFRIFNRWGELIYFSEDEKGYWDGKYNGKEQPIDGYLYQIEYFPTETRTKNLISKNGYFNLVK